MKYPTKFPDGTIIDGVFASEAIDTSGEILDVKGCDISELEEGKGVFNYEHRGPDSPGASPLDIVGRILYAKKIYSKEDCDDERQREYWNGIELPFIYGIGVLFDKDGHQGAEAIAAMIRHCLKASEPLIVKFSIEGSTLEKEGNVLKRSMARRVAVTLKPANRTALAGVIESDEGSGVSDTSKKDEKVDLSVLANFKKLGKYEGRYNPLFEFNYFDNLKRAVELSKTITAGSTNSAPGELVGGAALQKEDLKVKYLKSRIEAALRDWNKSEDLRTFIKNRLPEASDEYVDKFVDLVGYYKLKKSMEDIQKLNIGNMLQKVIITPLEKGQGFSEPQKTLLYKKVAGVAGLGKFVPATSFTNNFQTGLPMMIQGKVYGRHAQIPLTDHDQECLLPLLNNGTLDKIAILDKLFEINRNISNFIISEQNPRLFLVDNGLWMGSGFELPDFLNWFKPKHPGLNVSIKALHPEAMFWLEGLNENRIADVMRQCQAPEDLINKVVSGIANMKRCITARKDLTVADILNYDKLIGNEVL